MNWLPMFGAWQFAAAGLAGAVGTVLLHLLNRRRHQVLHWGAMAFLQQAVKKNRRVIQVRDAILLTLRTLAVLSFGLALARPHFAGSDTLAGPQPIHAIIVIDNSLSMAYRALDGSLLNQAKQSARELIERLPEGSSISLLAACGADSDAARDPMLDMQDALAAIEQIEIVDSTANIGAIFDRVRKAAAFETNQPLRIILLTDQQAATWASVPSAEDVRGLPQLQFVDVAPRQRDNTWVAEIGVQDGFAEARTASTILVHVERNGGNSVRHAEVSLLVHEQLVGTRTVLLQAGHSSQTVTFEHAFNTNATSGLVYVPIKAVITPDRLTIDDVRYALLPVVPRLPIVFVDQCGASEEDVRRGRIGETRTLRRLLDSDRDDDLREVVLGQRHVKLDELETEAIDDARLVVVAGVERPENKVVMLRRFVEEGGQLLIAAGGAFSARQWNDQAWLDGNGILPAPLTGRTLGATPDETQGELSPRLLSFESLQQSSWLRLPDVSDETLRDLYAEPLFFKTVEVNASQDFASSYRTVARLESPGGPPLFVERNIGKGRAMFFASGISSPWNTLPISNAVALLDRLAREMICSTIADHNTTTQNGIQIELPIVARNAKVMLQRPDLGVAEPLTPDYFDRERFGVTIPAVYRRGIYGVAALPVEEGSLRATADPTWNTEIAVNGDATESDLTTVDDASVAALSQYVAVSVAHSGEEVSLVDTQTVAHGLWWWFTLVVLALLLAETLILATAHRQRRTLREPEWVT